MSSWDASNPRQASSRYRQIGAPKSEAGQRTVPLPDSLLNDLRMWKLACPKTAQNLVFPTRHGGVHYHGSVIAHGLKPAVIAAGLTVPKRDSDGNPVVGKDGRLLVEAKYSGLHSLRHFFASWCINRVEDGGLGLPPKVVQELLGHSSIVMTLDVYGHLFPRGDDRHALDAAERALLA